MYILHHVTYRRSHNPWTRVRHWYLQQQMSYRQYLESVISDRELSLLKPGHNFWTEVGI